MGVSMPVVIRSPVGAIAALTLAVCALNAAAQETSFKEAGWAQLPKGRSFGYISAIDVDRSGNIWVADHCGGSVCTDPKVAPVVELTPSGKYLKSFGAGMFVSPHGIFVDRDDNIWVTDSESKDGKGAVVVKFNQNGKVLMTLGKPGVAGPGDDVFGQPTDVAVAQNGDIFVSDGHGGDGNARILKFSKDGKFIKTWGAKGSGPGQFNTPHALVFDSRGRLFVADRGNSRIQIFDQDGNPLAEWRQFGTPSGLFIDRNDTLYVTNTASPKDATGLRKGIYIGSAEDGAVTAFIPSIGADAKGAGGMVGEGVAVDHEGSVYWSETAGGMTVRKFIRR
jgi:sugar lactone lactonase YvrE